MSRAAAACALVLWAGATLVLAEVRWFRRRPLTERLAPYAPGGFRTAGGVRAGRPATFRALVGPMASAWGGRLARLVGVEEDLDARLRRIHAPLDAAAFRLRQLGWSGAGFAAGAVLAVAVRASLAISVVCVLGGALLAFLLVEQQLATASARRKRRLFLELPVVSEQMGMLIGAGYSLGAALNRLAQRGSGACAEDLAIVCGRVRQGLGEVDALREWSARADVPALSRLVAVLALNRETGDLGRLIAEEARSIRREVQRELIEQIERRSQQVWIPVTVATLVPGAVLLAVPFIEALRLFSST